MAKAGKVVRISACLYAVGMVFFLWGLAAGTNKVFPWKYIAPLYDEVHAFLSFKDGAPRSTKDKLLLHPMEIRLSHQGSGFMVRDKSFSDDGYLLISRYSAALGESTVELYSIAEEKVLYVWPLPLKEVEQKANSMTFAGGNPLDKDSFLPLHPLLLSDGGLVFSGGNNTPLVRVDACGNIVWMIDRKFHHSNEFDYNGNIVSPIVIEGKGPLAAPILDDGYAIVSPDGEILEEHSIAEILLRNGYRGLLYGVGHFVLDRIHLNDAQPVLFDTDDAKVGDILFSARSLSSVFLFEPDTGKIKWLQTGPWLNQHDINQLADGTYSIFGNDVFTKQGKYPRLVDKTKSDVYIFNPKNGTIEHPFSAVMAQEKISTLTSGRSRLLDNDDAFIEASDSGKLYRVSSDGVRWEYVNSVTPETVGMLSWSSYIESDKLELEWLKQLRCN